MRLHIAKPNQMTLFPEGNDNYEADIQALLDKAGRMRAEVLTGMVRDFFGGIRRTIRIARTIRSLNALSDATLADIGILRSQIPSIAVELAAGTFNRDSYIALASKAASTSGDAVRQPELPLAA